MPFIASIHQLLSLFFAIFKGGEKGGGRREGGNKMFYQYNLYQMKG